MIIISFLVFVFMFAWLIAGVFVTAVTLACVWTTDEISCFLWLCIGVFSLVCWYQVIVWGKPWFDVLAQAWM